MNGWIKLHKRVRKHWLWEHPEYFRAWVDMLMMANWVGRKTLYKSELHEIKRGEFPTSVRKLAQRWGWSVNKVRRFIELLKSDSMVDTQTDTGYTLVKIINYELFQTQTDTLTNTVTDTVTDTLTNTTIYNISKYKDNKEIKETKTQRAGARYAYPKNFLEFYESYPKKVGKKAALNAYKRCGVSNDVLIPAVLLQKKGEQWARGFIPNPATWLNQGRWEDEVETQDDIEKARSQRYDQMFES